MGNLNLQQLRERGAFVDPVPVPKEVTWERKGKDGEVLSDVFTVHVRRQSFGVVERMLSNINDDRSRSAMLVSSSLLFGDNADEVMSYDDAYQLDPSFAHVLIKAVNEVNSRKN